MLTCLSSHVLLVEHDWNYWKGETEGRGRVYTTQWIGGSYFYCAFIQLMWSNLKGKQSRGKCITSMLLYHNRSFSHIHTLHCPFLLLRRSTWTPTLVYSSPWTLLERGMEEDRSCQTISSSCFDLSPCQNRTMSRLQRLSSSLRDSKRPRLLEESWWTSSILQSELVLFVICPPSVLNQ